jgi:UDP-N-acetylmuramoyl-tripeptide--D-alanyl-D-alanine ligase
MRYLLFVAFLAFALRRLLTYLHIYQQEEYESVRFLKWLVASRAFDLRVSAVIVVAIILQLAIYLSSGIATSIVIVGLVAVACMEKDPRVTSKKRLVLTGRAKRIYWLAFLCVALAGFLCMVAGAALLLWLILVQSLPFSLAFANLVLTPYEKSIQKRFWNEAHQRLRSLRPAVVAITGSYGKTSTKHLLGHILEMQAPTLITPGSVNTPMGIARIVREQLGSHHRFFVCEMGAYGPGSIARLCRLAPPDAGVITAIGMAHYERFKTLDTVARAKFELAEAVANRDGNVTVAEQVLAFEAARAFQASRPANTVVVGPGENATFRILSSSQTRSGITADVLWKGRTFTLKAPIFGEHHMSNMALAFATACMLGVAPEDAIIALSSTPQIRHRLEVKRGVADSVLIDDAYNSNPVGFASGLRLLEVLSTNGGRRILVTPGMVELGPAHDEQHEKIGLLAASHVDVLLPVVPGRIGSFTAAYRRANANGIVVPCPTFETAQGWLNANVRENDVVLIENDLPDLYEKKPIL